MQMLGERGYVIQETMNVFTLDHMPGNVCRRRDEQDVAWPRADWISTLYIGPTAKAEPGERVGQYAPYRHPETDLSDPSRIIFLPMIVD